MNYPTNYFLTLLLCSLALTSLAQITRGEQYRSIDTIKADTNKVKALYDLAFTSQISSPEQTRAYSQKAIELARKSEDKAFLARILNQFGILYSQLGEHKAASKLLKEALEHSRATKEYIQEALSLNNLGNLYYRIGAPNKSLHYFLLAKDIALKNNMDKLYNILNANIGLTYSELGEKNIAIYYFIITLNSQKNNLKYIKHSYDNISRIYLNLGATYIETQKFDSAQVAIDSALYYLKKDTTASAVYFSLVINQAELFNAKGMPEKSISLILATLSNTKYTNIPNFELAHLYNQLSEAYLKTGQPQDALKYGELSKNLFKDDIYSTDFLNSNLHLAECYASLNNHTKAYEVTQYCHTIRDTIEARNEKQRLTLALVEHEIENNEKELVEANNQLRINATTYKIIGIATIPILLLIGFALLYRYRLNLQKGYAKDLELKVVERTKDIEEAHIQIQETKERENISLAMLNQQHSELLGHTIEKMKQWQKTNSLSDIQYSINELKAAQTKADEWGDFMMHLERVHPDFSTKLKSHCPDLSPNELKHCAYMKLGMSRKQVAETLHTTDNAVRLARNRIGKKLNISHDESIQEFINAL